MASFEFLSPSGSNLTNGVIAATNCMKLKVTRNTAPWIYSNYPEAIGRGGKGKAIADPDAKGNKYFINQQKVSGSGEVFFSHTNYTGKTLKIRVHIFNPNSSTVTVKRTNMGMSSGYNNAADTVINYFNSATKQFTLAKNGSAWLTDECAVPNGQPASGMIRFESDKVIIVTVYAYLNLSSVDGTETTYPYGFEWCDDKTQGSTKYPPVYTGLGNGNFITFAHGTIKVSDLLKKPYIYASNGDNYSHPNDNEIVPIKLLGTNLTASLTAAHDDLKNLGNWCTHNYNTITFKNDTTSAKTIYGSLCGNSAGNTQVINYKGKMHSKVLHEETWRWAKITLQAGETYALDFQHIIASYGAPATIHQWKV
ncbi:hypothetical protein ACEVJL_04540 [Pseudoflavonifractor sp. P01025]|uniref:hypothetical protein n=1 Tax=Flintibacter porci TaxID=3342383 RepID=UPI0035B583EA